MAGRIVAVVLVIVGWFVAVVIGVNMIGPPTEVGLATSDAPVKQATGPTTTTRAAPSRTEMRGCVIRFDSKDAQGRTQPRIHVNKRHACVGVSKAYADHETGDLVLVSPSRGSVSFITVSPDETLAELGVSCGASGGIGVTRIRCFDRDGVQIAADSPRLFDPMANLWVGWMMWAG